MDMSPSPLKFVPMSDNPFLSANDQGLHKTTPFLKTRVKPPLKSPKPDFDASGNTLKAITNVTRSTSRLQSLSEEFQNQRVEKRHCEDSDTEDEGCYNMRRGVCKVQKGLIHPYLQPDRVQTLFFLDLPTELLEDIVFYTRYPPLCFVDQLPPASTLYPGTDDGIDANLDIARQFISHRYSLFSVTRFTVSSLSKTCKTLRPLAEKVLYEDVSLDFQGLAGRKHSRYPAGSLKLLLRTLENRPDLCGRIFSVSIDYYSRSGDKAVFIESGLEQLLDQLPNLSTLVISPCPARLWTIPGLLKLKTFATTYVPGLLGAALYSLPNLRHLHLQGNIPMQITKEARKSGRDGDHGLKTISIASDNSDAVSHFTSVIRLCGDTVESLDFNFLGSLVRPSPLLHSPDKEILPSLPNTSLRSLRIDNISILGNTETSLAHLLQSMTTLENLFLAHHGTFAGTAFSYLPPRLRRLVITDYFPRWEPPENPEKEQQEYGEALGRCVLFAPEKMRIEKVTIRVNVEEDSMVFALARDCTNRDIRCAVQSGDWKPAVHFDFLV